MWPSLKGEHWDSVLDRLAADDYAIIDSFLPQNVLDRIEATFDAVEAEDRLHAAKIGHASEEQRISEIRSDYVHWLDRERDCDLEPFFAGIDDLRIAVGRAMYISLLGYEFHLAKYPPGAFYKAHLDQFDHRDNRQLSLVIYLNTSWQPGDGGELKIHGDRPAIVEPRYNRAVLFRSDRVLHEVLIAHKSRRSLTGWLLKRPSSVAVLGL